MVLALEGDSTMTSLYGLVLDLVADWLRVANSLIVLGLPTWLSLEVSIEAATDRWIGI